MWLEVRIAHANGADRLALGDLLTNADVRTAERRVHRVIAAAVLDDDGESVCAKWSDGHHITGRNGMYRRASRRGDPNAVPARRCVIGVQHATEAIQDRPLHGPVQLS